MYKIGKKTKFQLFIEKNNNCNKNCLSASFNDCEILAESQLCTRNKSEIMLDCIDCKKTTLHKIDTCKDCDHIDYICKECGEYTEVIN